MASTEVNDEVTTCDRQEHDIKEKAKARKSGPSLCSKTKELGSKARIFALAVYWDPTHHCYRSEVHLPEGQQPPDVNALMEKALSQRRHPLGQSHTRRRRRRGVRTRALSRRSNKKSTIDLSREDSEASVDDASLEGGSESDTVECADIVPTPPSKAESVVNQHQGSSISATSVQSENQMPDVPDSAQNPTQSALTSDLMAMSDNDGEGNWEIYWPDDSFDASEATDYQLSEERTSSPARSDPIEPVIPSTIQPQPQPPNLHQAPENVLDEDIRRVALNALEAVDAYHKFPRVRRRVPYLRMLPPLRPIELSQPILSSWPALSSKPILSSWPALSSRPILSSPRPLPTSRPKLSSRRLLPTSRPKLSSRRPLPTSRPLPLPEYAIY